MNILRSLRNMELDWLESMVLVHCYWNGRDLEELAGIADRSLGEINAAKRSLLDKARARLSWL
ncbi:MAG TPA: hypothetical protein GXX55_03575 [Firmicutes bacterium]|nr:hypothetical protein [Bacillota bacterium]